MSLNYKLLPDKGYERLEPDVAKVASPVLRRGRASNRSFLFGKLSRAVLRGLGVGNGPRLLGKLQKNHHNMLVGVTGSANYCDGYIEKMKCVRCDGSCMLWNSRTTGEIFTEGLTDSSGIAQSPITLLKYQQVQGKISAWELTSLDIYLRKI